MMSRMVFIGLAAPASASYNPDALNHTAWNGSLRDQTLPKANATGPGTNSLSSVWSAANESLLQPMRRGFENYVSPFLRAGRDYAARAFQTAGNHFAVRDQGLRGYPAESAVRDEINSSSRRASPTGSPFYPWSNPKSGDLPMWKSTGSTTHAPTGVRPTLRRPSESGSQNFGSTYSSQYQGHAGGAYRPTRPGHNATNSVYDAAGQDEARKLAETAAGANQANASFPTPFSTQRPPFRRGSPRKGSPEKAPYADFQIPKRNKTSFTPVPQKADGGSGFAKRSERSKQLMYV